MAQLVKLLGGTTEMETHCLSINRRETGFSLGRLKIKSLWDSPRKTFLITISQQASIADSV